MLQAEELKASLESAFLWVHEKDGDENRDRALANLGKVIEYLEGRTATL